MPPVQTKSLPAKGRWYDPFVLQHSGAKIRLRRLQQQVVVVIHQDLRMHPPTRPLAGRSQSFQK